MKYNMYNNRRQARYGEPKTPPIGKKLMEQFLTQVVVCAVLIIAIISVQLLGFKQVETGLDKVKSAIVYSPSLDEITQNTKDIFLNIISSIKREDQDEAIIPVISIDDEVF